ncbi:MAG: hypothetical protein PHC64_11420 [Candidatus Gastranaerophilales bacterium]|nr:hypothetical protein [Candidatus Gastranaerophilales bacterium]
MIINKDEFEKMKTNINERNIVYCILSVAASLLPVTFLYLEDVHDKNLFTIIIKYLSQLI